MNPLLLLHGAIGAKEQFDSLKSALADHFDVHMLDFEGHGAAARVDRPFSMAHFAENVLGYLDANGIEQVDIFGHSMGGYVGLVTAHTAPKRVGRVFTLGTKFAWSPEVAAQEIKNLDPDKMLAKVPKFAQMLDMRHQNWRENLAKTREMMVALGEHSPLSLEQIAHIEQPVRIGLGDKDRMVTLAETAEVYQALPNSQLQVLPSTPHPIERVEMKRLAAAMVDFFA